MKMSHTHFDTQRGKEEGEKKKDGTCSEQLWQAVCPLREAGVLRSPVKMTRAGSSRDSARSTANAWSRGV